MEIKELAGHAESDDDDALHAPVPVGEEGSDPVAGRACARALVWQQFGNGREVVQS